MSGPECSVCLESLKYSGDVCSTNCGHIFHKQCLDECKERLNPFTCPQCRHPNPAFHKIYLNLEETGDGENVELLKTTLSETELKLQKMEKIVASERYSQILSSSNSNLLMEPFGRQAVIIKGVSINDIKSPLAETVLMLTNIMDLPCEHADIETVFILDRKYLLRTQNQCNKFNVAVKFSTEEMRNLFMDKKSMLVSKGITLTEYVDQNTNELFTYAKLLTTRDFKHVFFRNNCIFAQKNDNDILHQIHSKQDVDRMLA
ncbi:uncharacterized protein LOC118736534 [Rhagoletis pomonella]|uniref:uncharacterized protein LOC118736534 n=1 Tax=Rhagoletis pomonella TaxID=28610 RepID=UPI0017860C7F|nr:uncharacterized protein LOC118736534 [Rhagoletis pomonella]